MRQLLLAVTMWCVAMPATAADIRAVGPAGSERIRIDGAVAPGDRDRFAAALAVTQTNGVLIESTAGDLTEAAAIGSLVREALLPVTATGPCGGGCVLIWVAGVARSTRQGLDPGGLADDAAAVGRYLARMEIDAATTAQLLASGPLTPVEAIDLLGAASPAHTARLAKHCGTLTVPERADWQAAQALDTVEAALNAMAGGMGGGQSMYVVDAETERQAAAARALDPDYRRALTARQAGITQCRRTAVTEWRATQPSSGR